MKFHAEAPSISCMDNNHAWKHLDVVLAAFDKTDLLYLRDFKEQERTHELDLRESETQQFASLRSKLDDQTTAQAGAVRLAVKEKKEIRWAICIAGLRSWQECGLQAYSHILCYPMVHVVVHTFLLLLLDKCRLCINVGHAHG